MCVGLTDALSAHAVKARLFIFAHLNFFEHIAWLLSFDNEFSKALT